MPVTLAVRLYYSFISAFFQITLVEFIHIYIFREFYCFLAIVETVVYQIKCFFICVLIINQDKFKVILFHINLNFVLDISTCL